LGISKIAPFAFEKHQVRVIAGDCGAPWFVAADVCAALGLDNTTKALLRLNEDEQALISIQAIHAGTGNPMVNGINESGIYSLILTSRKPEAKRFKKWVTAEVLPSIRQTGAYLAPGATLDSLPPALASQVGGIIKSVVHKQIADALAFALPQMIEGVLAKRSVGIRHGRTSAQVWQDWGLPPLKNGSLKLSRWLCDFACGDGSVETATSHPSCSIPRSAPSSTCLRCPSPARKGCARSASPTAAPVFTFAA
jgi:prophage antirepressor-like protein